MRSNSAHNGLSVLLEPHFADRLLAVRLRYGFRVGGDLRSMARAPEAFIMGASAVSLNWLYDWRASGDDTLPTSNYHTFIITPAKAGAHAGIDPGLRRETRN